MRKRKVYTVMFLAVCIPGLIAAQNQSPLTVKYSYPNNIDRGIVKIEVLNRSSRTYYYSITLSGFINGSWKPLLSDINSLGMNEFTKLKPISSGVEVAKSVQLKRIYLEFAYSKLTKIRFGVMYYTKRDFESKGGGITYTDAL